jgi:hypothetical protein
MSRRMPPLGEELYEHYPAMSAQTHEAHVKEYAKSVVSALQAELAKAREALKPFSTDADIYDGQDIDDGEKSFNDNITVGDLRRAREVYRALQQKEREA